MQNMHKISLENFAVSEKALKVIAKISNDWYAVHKTAVPVDYFVEIVKTEVIPKNLLNYEEVEQLSKLAEYVYSEVQTPISELESHILQILDAFIELRVLKPAAAQLAGSSNFIEAVNSFAKLTKESRTSVELPDLDLFGEIPLLSPSNRVSWNCDFLDIILSGGSLPGETTLFLAPSGGGKTLSNIQIACDVALNNQHAMIFSYEQAVVPGLSNRMYSYLLGLPINFFQGLTAEQFQQRMATDKALKTLWETRRQAMKQRLKMVDMLDFYQNATCRGVEDIRDEVEKFRQKTGHNPRYIGIDWFGPLINYYMGSSAFNMRKGAAKFEIMMQVSDDMRKLGTELQTNIFIYHQLGTDACRRRPIDLPSAGDAYECKGLQQYMDNVICVGNRTVNNNLAYVHVPKCRSGMAGLKACIQMDGALSRWKYISDRIVDDGTGGLMIPGVYNNNEEDSEETGGRRNLVAGNSPMDAPAVSRLLA